MKLFWSPGSYTTVYKGQAMMIGHLHAFIAERKRVHKTQVCVFTERRQASSLLRMVSLPQCSGGAQEIACS